MSAARIQELKAMLEARTDGQGKARPGYKRNIIAVQAEIRRLEAELARGGDVS